MSKRPTSAEIHPGPGFRLNRRHFMIAVDIGRFMPLPVFHARMDALAAWLTSSGDPGPVLLPGEARWRARGLGEALGIALDAPTVEALRRLAGDLGVAMPPEIAALQEAQPM